VDHGLNILMGLEHCMKPCFIQQICLEKGKIFSRNVFDPVKSLGGGVDKIIEYHHVMALVQQFNAGMAADISGTASDKNFHWNSL
jgi:hypothetical protein